MSTGYPSVSDVRRRVQVGHVVCARMFCENPMALTVNRYGLIVLRVRTSCNAVPRDEKRDANGVCNPNGVFRVSGQKYAMSQMKTVVSTVVRMARIETLGTVEDVQVNFQIVIRIESAPKMKFYAV